MGFYFDQTSSASPVAVLQPQRPMSQSYNINPDGRDMSSFCPRTPHPQTPSSAAGRKRSRDEAADNLEDNSYFPPPVEPIQESEEGWEYGEGMTLIKPNGFIIDASSQTGTWAEENAQMSQPQTTVLQNSASLHDRLDLRSHKSQRLGLTATPLIDEELTSRNGIVVATSDASLPKTALQEPTVDAFTIHLGIGWSRISSDEHIQAAARGWARFIENHYPMSSVQIRLQSKGLASYLVEANEGWFLFGEDLKEGRLVSTSLDRTFENLRTSPPVFDGADILTALAETPKSDMDMETKQEIMMGDSEMLCSVSRDMAKETSSEFNQAQEVAADRVPGVQDSAQQHLEIEMDMS